MNCKKCKSDIPDGAMFCPACGVRQVPAPRKPKSRGNGMGSVFKRGNGWIAVKTIGYETDAAGKLHRITVSKSGFSTKKEAVMALPSLTKEKRKEPKEKLTLKKAYEAWEPTHKAGKSTINCYRAALKWFAPLHYSKLEDIDVDDLQECMDECEAGKRTRQNMKAMMGLVYKWAIPRHQASMNLAQYLVVNAEENDAREGIPLDDLEKIRNLVGTNPYADHVVAQCYLGFRPSELLALDISAYNRNERAFVGGAKTDAGTNRTVTVSPKIQSIINRHVADRIAGQVFCKPDGSSLNIKAYRAEFYKLLEQAGIENPVGNDGRKKYTPHSCRHTFATMMKSVSGSNKDKLALIGHTSDTMLRHYQDVSYEDLRKITDAL